MYSKAFGKEDHSGQDSLGQLALPVNNSREARFARSLAELLNHTKDLPEALEHRRIADLIRGAILNKNRAEFLTQVKAYGDARTSVEWNHQNQKLLNLEQRCFRESRRILSELANFATMPWEELRRDLATSSSVQVGGRVHDFSKLTEPEGVALLEDLRVRGVEVNIRYRDTYVSHVKVKEERGQIVKITQPTTIAVVYLNNSASGIYIIDIVSVTEL